MTIPEITAYVMALPAEELRRLTATDVMGWSVYGWDINPESLPYIYYGAEDNKRIQEVRYWRPDIDRNQSRMVTDRVIGIVGGVDYILAFGAALGTCVLSGDWFTLDGEVQILRVMQASALDESRAALIAHMIHAEERLWRYRLIHKEKSYGDTA